MPPIECMLFSHSLQPHLSPVYTGFLLLHKQGLIRLSQQCTREEVPTPSDQHLRGTSGAHLRVLVNGRIRLHYDVHDAQELCFENVERCDFYFKRSFSSEYVSALPEGREKILPLGLNYSVLPNCVDVYALQRARELADGLSAKLLSAIDAIDGGNVLRYNTRLRHLEALPQCNAPPRVLFLVNAYDPYDHPERTRQKIEEYLVINETRAQCIRLLRKNLGRSFLGGFTHNAFTRRQYPDLLVDQHAITRRKNYLRTLKDYCICVATTGLHGSIGWKFGEYIALSKAIVSERLCYQVPGDLDEGNNYLAFNSPDECVEQCASLMGDSDTRIRLMQNNALYYRSYVRPDSLVMNTLIAALDPAGRHSLQQRIHLQVSGCGEPGRFSPSMSHAPFKFRG